ncbi:MAG: polyphenol oxidase family protein [Spirochaetales bacterium]
MKKNELNFHACLTLLSAGSMRFRHSEKNQNRIRFFNNFFENKEYSPVSPELIHSKTVAAIDKASEAENCRLDGIITCNPLIVPVVTVADCMPIYIWDEKTGCFGVLHSGWKGTGIIAQALSLAYAKYGAKKEDFHIILGPHIHDCCYIIDEERAQYFKDTFGTDCVASTNDNTQFRLSLKKANLFLLQTLGVPRDNILCIDECTCCKQDTAGKELYGSFRRETAHLPSGTPLTEMHKNFTPMAAFMYRSEKNERQKNIFLKSFL